MARHVSEDFLHYIWKYKLFDQTDLRTTDGDSIKVHSPGLHNTHAGPDFQNARITIGETLWAGNVEIHVDENDWIVHHHHQDPAYENVILHVVYDAVKPGHENIRLPVPTLQLRQRIDPGIIVTYRSMMSKRDWVPCANMAGNVDAFIWAGWLDRMLVERLDIKTAAVEKELMANQNDWEKTLYVLLARSFGFKVNSLPMEMLARAVPLEILMKAQHNQMQMEALLFGQAGFLVGEGSDAHTRSLASEYHFLQKKYGLKPMSNHIWRFLRLRPVNFPTVRIAQFANLMVRNQHVFSKLLAAKGAGELADMLQAEAGEYWTSHYAFGKTTKASRKNLGIQSRYSIVINTMIPVLFTYGKFTGNHEICDRALAFMSQVPAEVNSVTVKWSEIGIKATDAGQTQALIHLKNRYCNLKKCLNCGIGIQLIK